MSRMQDKFRELKEKGERALVGFVTAGDPDYDKSLSVLRAMLQNGVDVLELGVPFSDPTADGPVIQRSSQRALASGMKLQKVLDITKTLREEFDQPIVLFSYYNPILAFGLDKFYASAVEAGADGVLVVDLPPEESDELTDAWPQNAAMDLIRLVAPTTGKDRMGMIAQKASGFIYLVSMTGVTGSGGLDTKAVEQVTGLLKDVTEIPVCVGFGITTPAQAAEVAKFADGVVVGTAFERLIEENADDPKLIDKIEQYTHSLKQATTL